MQYAVDWTKNMDELASESMAMLRDRYQNRNTIKGLASGFHDLDAMTWGFLPGSFTILGGRPSMGKTALVLNIVKEIAIEQKQSTLLITTGDSKEQISQRLLSMCAKVDSNRLRTGNMLETDWHRLNAEVEKLRTAALVIEDRLFTVDEIYQNCRQAIESGVELKLLVIDYIQLLRRTEEEFCAQENRISTSRRLKRLASDLNIAVIACSQIHRSLEYRRNKRPIMIDLRGEVEDGDGADLVMFLYRDDYYYPESEQRGEAELIIAKQRHGPVGAIELLYKASTCNFSNKVGWDDASSIDPWRTKPMETDVAVELGVELIDACAEGIDHAC